MTKLRNRPLGEPLKEHPAYIADREAKLAQFAIETPTCWFVECTDCCYLERDDARRGVFFASNKCPECGGDVRSGTIMQGEVLA